MNFKDLKKSLKTEIHPCYVLSPEVDYEDRYLKSSCINNIITSSITNFSELNLNIFSTENLNETMLMNSLNTLPFLNDKRVVVIEEYDNKKNDKLIKMLLEYLKNPNLSTILVIDEKVNSAFKALEKSENVCVVDCSRVDSSILKAFILKECSTKNFQIEENAIKKLIEFTNSDMSKLSLELNKLINLKLFEKEIKLFDVEQNVTKSDEYQVFELTNALMQKNGDRAIYIVDDIIRGKKNINAILSLIFNHFRRMFYVKINSNNLSETAKLLQVKEYALIKIKEQSAGFSAMKLKDILYLCKNTDYLIKSGKIDLINGIYNLIFSILV